jgi:hypothetical protein
MPAASGAVFAIRTPVVTLNEAKERPSERRVIVIQQNRAKMDIYSDAGDVRAPCAVHDGK